MPKPNLTALIPDEAVKAFAEANGRCACEKCLPGLKTAIAAMLGAWPNNVHLRGQEGEHDTLLLPLPEVKP